MPALRRFTIFVALKVSPNLPDQRQKLIRHTGKRDTVRPQMTLGHRDYVNFFRQNFLMDPEKFTQNPFYPVPFHCGSGLFCDCQAKSPLPALRI